MIDVTEPHAFTKKKHTQNKNARDNEQRANQAKQHLIYPIHHSHHPEKSFLVP
jgi:hypothetical protein